MREVGAAPETGDADEPSGETIEVLAAPINPIDLSRLSRRPRDRPPGAPVRPRLRRRRHAPPTAGSSGSSAARSDGRRTERWPSGRRSATRMRSKCPDGVDPALAGALGIAGLAGWLPFAWRAPLTGGENVLVLGATGSVGLVAVQSAKLLGAATRGRCGTQSAPALERALSSTEPTRRSASTSHDLVAAFKNAFGGDGAELRLRPALGRARGRSRRGGRAPGDDRQPRPVGGRDGRSCHRPPSASRACRSSGTRTSPSRRRAGRALPPSRRSCPRRRDPAGRRARPARRGLRTPGAVRQKAPARSSSSCRKRARSRPRLRRHVEDDEEQDDDVNPCDEQDAFDQLLCLRVGRPSCLDRRCELVHGRPDPEHAGDERQGPPGEGDAYPPEVPLPRVSRRSSSARSRTGGRAATPAHRAARRSSSA